MFPRALGHRALPSLRAFEIQGNGSPRPIAEGCFAPAKRDMAVTTGEWLENPGTVHESAFTLGALSSDAQRVSTRSANCDAQVP